MAGTSKQALKRVPKSRLVSMLRSTNKASKRIAQEITRRRRAA